MSPDTQRWFLMDGERILGQAVQSSAWYEMPAGGQVHALTLSGPIVLVQLGSAVPAVLKLIALTGAEPSRERFFRVFDTGAPLPGTIITHRGAVHAGATVLHLIEGFTADALKT